MRATVWPKPWVWIASLAVIVVWYPLLSGCLWLIEPHHPDFGLTFNSMAEHLLAGRFDVDPDAIGGEAFIVQDRIVSYFGIFCALLRLPLVLTGFARTDVTWWSCLIAICLATWIQLRTIALVWRPDAPPRRSWLAAALWIGVLLGGQHIQFLRASLWQEAVDWGFCQAMGFVFLAARGLTTDRGFDRSTLCWMAVCAGLALLTRVSFGVGLYAAFGLLLLARVRPRFWLLPVGVALVFAGMAAIVNEGRWGNALTFADFSRYALSQDVYPDRLGRLAAYGTFNLARIWLGLGYYFFPIWIWIRPDGHVLFAEAQATLMDAMELPAGSFAITDPLLLWLAGLGVLATRDRARAALLLGLCAPPMLMLCAISMAHRYRMEFYPLFFLAALFGVTASTGGAVTRRFRATVIGLVVSGVVASHGMAVLSALSPWGPGERALERHGFLAPGRRDQSPSGITY